MLARASGVTTLLCLFADDLAAAADAGELLRDGNRLFRDDLYYAALLRDERAGEASMDAPLLHYNTGVAHYGAGQQAGARA